jgi:hypothetical protein
MGSNCSVTWRRVLLREGVDASGLRRHGILANERLCEPKVGQHSSPPLADEQVARLDVEVDVDGWRVRDSQWFIGGVADAGGIRTISKGPQDKRAAPTCEGMQVVQALGAIDEHHDPSLGPREGV